jgi:hypothetical protein
MTHSTNDLTENFEYALATTGSLLVHAMSDKDMVAFKSRCDDCCFNARPQSINDMMNTPLGDGQYLSLIKMFGSPCCIRVSLYERGRVAFYPIGYVFDTIDPDSLPDEVQRTYDTNTNEAAGYIVDLMRDVIRDSTLYHSVKNGDIALRITGLIGQSNGDMCHEQIVNMLSHARDTGMGMMVGVWKYDLANDKYVYWMDWLA